MRVTTSLLADAATVCDGKLYIHGAGWDTINSSVVPMVHPSIAVVFVLEVDPVEEDQHRVEIRLVDDADTVVVGVKGHVGVSDSSNVVPGTTTNLPVALNFPTVTFPHAGAYRFVLLINDAELHSLKLSVVATAG